MPEIERKFMIFIINRVVTFKAILSYAGVSISGAETNIFCPFHDNTDTPAAKLYRFDTGDVIKCFAENKTYRPYDVIRLGMVERPLEDVFDRIWAQLPAGVRDSLSSEYGAPLKTMPDNWDLIKEKASRYRRGEMPIEEVLSIILEVNGR